MGLGPHLRHRSPSPGLLACLAAAGGTLLLASTAFAAPAVYRMEADTQSGMGGEASGMAMMQMLMGQGQPAVRRSLMLTLSSPRTAPSAPRAEHLIPAGLGLGTALPLVTPSQGVDRGAAPTDDPELTKPKGRLVIFRGCAGSPAADEPEVIDFARLLPDQRQLAMQLRTGAATLQQSTPPGGTVGTWPDVGNAPSLPASASLVGEHRVTSNYAPEIRFRVDASHDFLAPVRLQTRGNGETMELSWNAVPTALGTQARAFGAGTDEGDVVIWTSSTVPWAESGVPADLDASTARGLVSRGVLMPPEQTRCTISAAAMRQLGQAIVQFQAYGDTLRIAGAPEGAGSSPGWTLTLARESSATLPLMGMPGSAGSEGGESPAPRGGGGGWRLVPGLF